jgi:exopolysaccharide biosynthesis polyprenyl glycosylphosphotransferase
VSESLAPAELAETIEELEFGSSILDVPQRASKRKRGWLVRRVLLASDVVGLLVAFFLAEFANAGVTSGNFDLVSETLAFLATLPGWALVARVYGLYSQDDQRTNHATTDEVANVFNMVTVCTWLFFAFSWVSGVAHPKVEKLLVFWALATIAVPLARTAGRGLARRTPAFIQNTIIVGAGDVGQTIAEKLRRHPEYGVNVVGFVDSEPREQRESLSDLTILGPPQDLQAIVQANDVERVIIAFSRASHEEVLGLIRSLKDAFVQVDIVSRYYELVSPSTGLSTVEGIPVLCLPPRALGASAKFLKRAVDVTVSVAGLVLLAPIMVFVAIAIFLDSPGGILFRQPRIGEGGKTFEIFKFRTMVLEAEEMKEAVAHMSLHADGDARMFKIADDPRVTRVGRILRKLSLDEFPQLLNVLRGEMSLVGPRPLIPSEDVHVEDWGRDRLSLRPGMTGLWQVLGRSEIPFEEMVRLDYLYVTNWSIWQDFRLMCGTLPAMLKGGRGAY